MTASPGLVTAQGRWAMPSLEPRSATTWRIGSTLTPEAFLHELGAASRKTLSPPPTAGYCWLTRSRMALLTASTMNSGVFWSGSPTPRLMTSAPAAMRSRFLRSISSKRNGGRALETLGSDGGHDGAMVWGRGEGGKGAEGQRGRGAEGQRGKWTQGPRTQDPDPRTRQKIVIPPAPYPGLSSRPPKRRFRPA